MENNVMANGDEKLFNEIKDSYKEIGTLLEKENINTREVMKKFLSTNRLIMAFFIGTFLDDHSKVETMYTSYKVMMFVTTVFGVSLIALIWSLITGQAMITVVK